MDEQDASSEPIKLLMVDTWLKFICLERSVEGNRLLALLLALLTNCVSCRERAERFKLLQTTLGRVESGYCRLSSSILKCAASN